jgi:hypothetical protein
VANGFRLGVDFGVSHTAAVLSWPDDRTSPLLFDGSPLLPSAVYLEPSGTLLTGNDALHAARANPAGLEPYPKRRIDAGAVRLGEAEVPVTHLVAAVLGRVAAEAARVAAAPIVHAVLTCPASWGPDQRDVLLAAAAMVFGPAELVPEPVAAARHLVHTGAAALPAGSCVAVYDLGAGTFDASVVRRSPHEFEVLATSGLPDAGGLYLDAAIMDQLGAGLAAGDPERWQRLTTPATDEDRRASRQLWDDVRAGKEMLARTSGTTIHIPLFEQDVALDRAQLDQLAAPILDRTVAATHAALHAAGVQPSQLAALFLVGGATRQLLVAPYLHRAFGVAPVVVDQPELAVADGSLRGPAAPRRRTGLLVGIGAAATALVLAAAVGTAVALASSRGGADPTPEAVASEAVAGASPSTDATGSAGPSASSPASPTPSPVVSSVADPCLVGTWTLTSIVRDHQIDGVTVRTSSEGGAVDYYRPDGTFLTDLDRGHTEVGSAGGHRYEIIATGTIRGNYRTSGDQLLWSDNRADGELIVRRDGTEYFREPATAVTGSGTYVCEPDSLYVYYDDAGNFEYERTSTDWD